MNAQTKSLERNAVKVLLSQDVMKKKFEEVLGDRAPQFIASISNVGAQLKDVEPMSIIAAAFIAATLDLPIDKNLGFAHIVPYGASDDEGNRRKVAQFQMGYKGFIQLALRTGLYERLNAKAINAEAFGGYDEVGEPKIAWEKVDESKPVAGYAFAWKLTNGFTKIVYWTKERAIRHATLYSQAYKRDLKRGKKDSLWSTNQDAMGLKTVIKDGLTHWGILSIQMQSAIVHDQGTQQQIGGDVDYIDGESITDSDTTETPQRGKGKLADLTEKLKTEKPPVDAVNPELVADAERKSELQDARKELKEALVMLRLPNDEAVSIALKNASMVKSDDGHETWMGIDHIETVRNLPWLRNTIKKLKDLRAAAENLRQETF